jgi:hypothetical protein
MEDIIKEAKRWQQAEENLIAIWDYTALHNLYAADRLLLSMFFPNRGHLWITTTLSPLNPANVADVHIIKGP